MGWLFRDDCPVDEAMCKWIEYRMQWLANEFGIKTWWNAPAVMPTNEFFPDRYDRSEHAVIQMMNRVCGFMSIDPENVTLRLYSESPGLAPGGEYVVQGRGTAGLYSRQEKHVVMVEVGGIEDPETLVATLAHELCHARLLGEDRVTGNEEDHEQLTDLATVFFGMGIFTANSAMKYRQWTKEQRYGWSASRHGYLSEPAISYALALWSYVRQEKTWFGHLRPNVKSVVKQGLRYLEKNPPAWYRERRKPSDGS
jgi:hypothetical protein